MNNELTAKVQKVNLEIFDYFRDVCKKLNIKYILLAGSTLGAVRHKGFIPWDDDLDVGILRSDYDRLLDYLMNTAEKSPFFLQCYNTDKNYAHGYAKILKKGTYIEENTIPNVLARRGIFIDIFPLDNYPENGRKKLDSVLLKLTNIELHTRMKYNENVPLQKKIIHKIISAMFIFVNSDKLVKLREKIATKYGNKTRYVVNLFTTYDLKKELIERRYVENPKSILFEGRNVYIQANWQEYLTNLYGNYKKLPPKDKRINSHLKKVIFNERT
jgi:lipopolysaccharide cholinephosphotransferase